jgi:hypothetical protein
MNETNSKSRVKFSSEKNIDEDDFEFTSGDQLS